MTQKATPTNIPEYSVSELASAIKQTLESGYGRVRVRGELSRVKIHTSGHMYSVLKDDQSNLDVVCWRGTLSKIPINPEEGLEVICTGRISSYPARSNYQLIIETMELAGEGALLKMLEQRRKALAEEGLFNHENKQNLPYLPDVIGVVTSPTGAVIQDIMHRINDRFPRPVYLWPVLVQGEGAADQIAQAIKGFNTLSKQSAVPRPDVLIVGRGGGSLEDLMPFNEEQVVRAIFESSIPVISAVGHETDTTLTDFVADKRAPTPTGAAEIAVPRRADLIAYVGECNARLTSAVTRQMTIIYDKMTATAARLTNPNRYLDIKTQALDICIEKLNNSFSSQLYRLNILLSRHGSRLTHPSHKLSEALRIIEDKAQRLTRASARIVPPKKDQLTSLERMLESLSYTRVLERGYVVIKNSDQKLITNPEDIDSNQKADIVFARNKTVQAILNPDQQIPCAPKKIKKNHRKKHSNNKKSSEDDQHQLF